MLAQSFVLIQRMSLLEHYFRHVKQGRSFLVFHHPTEKIYLLKYHLNIQQKHTFQYQKSDNILFVMNVLFALRFSNQNFYILHFSQAQVLLK